MGFSLPSPVIKRKELNIHSWPYGTPLNSILYRIALQTTLKRNYQTQKQKHWKRESSLPRILSVVYEVKVGHDDENEFNTVCLMVTIWPEWQMTVIDMAAERINPAEQPTPEFLLGWKNPFKTFLLQSYSDVLFWLLTRSSQSWRN